MIKLLKSAWPKKITCRQCDTVFTAEKEDCRVATWTGRFIWQKQDDEWEELTTRCPDCNQPTPVK